MSYGGIECSERLARERASAAVADRDAHGNREFSILEAEFIRSPVCEADFVRSPVCEA